MDIKMSKNLYYFLYLPLLTRYTFFVLQLQTNLLINTLFFNFVFYLISEQTFFNRRLGEFADKVLYRHFTHNNFVYHVYQHSLYVKKEFVFRVRHFSLMLLVIF